VEKIEYQGWRNNLRLSNGEAELIVTLDVGPRILNYRLAGGKNVFKEYADQLGKAGEKGWQIRGGHRLWIAPEDLTRTYAEDNGPVKHVVLSENPLKVRFIPAPETEYGMQKEIDVELAGSGSRVIVTHRIINIGDKPAALAAWALSVMAPGGVEIIPLPEKKPHPGSPKSARSPADFAPNQHMAVWSYTDFQDSRWTFGNKFITLRQDPKKGPTKIGLAHRLGWIGYLNGGTLFVKWIDYQEGKHYPDGGCNFETFSNEDMLEVESLGPLVQLQPGAKVENVEHWLLVKDVDDFRDEAGIEKNIVPKVGKK